MIKELSRPEVLVFIKTHENDDPADLVLKYSGKTDLHLQLIAGQIRSRQKAKKKLPEWYQTNGLLFPIGVSIEQCSSEATAKYKSQIIGGGSLVDLTGGSGVDTFYLSQVFEKARYIEPNEELCRLANHNFSVLSKDSIEVINDEAERYLEHESQPGDVYFIDPSRRDEHNQKVFLIEYCQPRLDRIFPLLLSRGSKLLIKLSPLVDIQNSINQLANVSQVHVVSVNNECKEVLFLLDPSWEGEARIIAINLHGSEVDKLEFFRRDEETLPEFSAPKTYLYEPNASILKAGAYNSIAHEYGLVKLHRNSHLYTSESLIKEFPGRSFQIRDVGSVSRKFIKQGIPDGKANVTVRNFPQTVEKIRKLTGLKEGGNVYLFATTLSDGSTSALICSKI